MNYTVIFDTGSGVKIALELDLSEENVSLANVLFKEMKVLSMKFFLEGKELALVLIPKETMDEAGIDTGKHVLEVDKKRKRIILKGGDKNGKSD